jgi:hypothetical protein
MTTALATTAPAAAASSPMDHRRSQLHAAVASATTAKQQVPGELRWCAPPGCAAACGPANSKRSTAAHNRVPRPPSSTPRTTQDFTEVTVLFEQLAPDQSHASAQRAAAEAMILSDRDTDTRLALHEFSALLSK